MDDRSTKITIAGKEYELVFTTKATKDVSKKYGSLEKMGEVLKEQGVDESLNDVVWLVTLLANQGIMRKNMLENKNEPLLTTEQVEILTTPGDYNAFSEALREAIVKGTQRFVQSEAKN